MNLTVTNVARAAVDGRGRRRRVAAADARAPPLADRAARLDRAHRRRGLRWRAVRRHARHARARVDTGTHDARADRRRGRRHAASSPRSPPAVQQGRRRPAQAVTELGEGRIPAATGPPAHRRARGAAHRARSRPPRPGRDPRARAGAGVLAPRAGVLGQPRPAHAAGRAAGHGRGARGRRRRRPGALLQADRRLGRPAQPDGRGPVRPVAHPGRRAVPRDSEHDRAGRSGLRLRRRARPARRGARASA